MAIEKKVRWSFSTDLEDKAHHKSGFTCSHFPIVDLSRVNTTFDDTNT